MDVHFVGGVSYFFPVEYFPVKKGLTPEGVSYRMRILGSHCFVSAAARCFAAAAIIFSISSGSRGSLRLSSS